MNFPVVQLLTKEAQYTSDSRFSPLSLSLQIAAAAAGADFFLFPFFAFVLGSCLAKGAAVRHLNSAA
jgi:hypothetical protein